MMNALKQFQFHELCAFMQRSLLQSSWQRHPPHFWGNPSWRTIAQNTSHFSGIRRICLTAVDEGRYRPKSREPILLQAPGSHPLPLDSPEESMDAQETGNVITVPVRLRQRLLKKKKVESTRWSIEQQILERDRQGDKRHVILSCKRPKFNHYLSQTYARGSEVPLASKSWHHRKAAGDWIAIRPLSKHATYGFSDGDSSTFSDLEVNSKIVERLTANNALTPTIIQALGIPKILGGSHCVLTAETGCGKTLAYLIPIVQQILEQKKRRLKRGVNQPLAVILLPSHELADQIHYVAYKLTEGLGVDIKLVRRGGIGSKIANPASGNVDLLISTVHVLSTLKSVGLYQMNRVQHLVLDEADTLLDDSFSPDILQFLTNFELRPAASPPVQLLLVGATFPKTIESTLSNVFELEKLVHIMTPSAHHIMPHVPQYFFRVKKSNKPESLLNALREDVEQSRPVIIFCNRTKTCVWLASYLKENDIPCVALHGSCKPGIRKGLMQKYQDGEANVLVATDLGSRGINTIRTQHVINYEFPMFNADYIHRCGRTGRVGGASNCKVTSFITRRYEFKVVQDIELSVRKGIAVPSVDGNIKRLLSSSQYGMYQPIIISDEEKRAKANS